MRIARLDLKAYGHFTDHPLEFSGVPDFHIVYGPNEAGKTTMSRALQAALFGFPRSTTDDFKHSYANLRVGVVLESAEGTLAAMRRKATKNSLIKFDPTTGEELGEAIPDDLLPRWMGGLSEGLYTSMFSLGHDELVAGGKALSAGEGEIGQSLFEAGAGLTSIRTLREQLQGEADRLFRPQARTLAIHQTINTYAAAKKVAREAQTRPAQWETLRKAADEAKHVYETARGEQERLQQESRRLERLAAVLPDIASRTHALERLVALGEVKQLEADAREKRIAAEARLQHAEDTLTQANDDLARLQQELDDVPRFPVMIAEGGAIEAAYYSLDSFREARDDAAAAGGRIELARRQVAELAAVIGEMSQDDLRSVIPGATLRARVQGLDAEGQAIKRDLRLAVETRDTTQTELQELSAELDDLGPQSVPPSLPAALRAFDADGNPEVQAAELARQVKTQRARLESDAKALSDKGLNAVVTMTTPMPSEIQSFRERRDELKSRKQSIRDRLNGLEDDLGSVSGEIEGLLHIGDVPTAEHLAEQRGVRDDLWQKIRRKAFPDDKEILVPLPTATEYEMAVLAADGTADTRFTDAARVSLHAELVKRQRQMQNGIEIEHGRLSEVERQIDDLKQSWMALISKHGLPVQAVPEVSEWIAGRESLMQRYQDFMEIEAQAADASSRTTSGRIRLSEALIEAGLPSCDDESLAQAIARARKHIDEAGKAATSQQHLMRRKTQAEGRLAKIEGEIGDQEKALVDWRTLWERSMGDIRLDGGALGIEATARLAQFSEFETALDALDEGHAALNAAHVIVTRTEDEAKRLGTVVGYASEERPADAVIETLYERLKNARDQEQRARTLTEKTEEIRRLKAQNEQAITAAKGEIATLMAAAGCQSLPDLVEAESLSADRIRLDAELAAINARLVQASALPLQDLLAQAEGQDLVLVHATLDRVGEDLKAAVTQVQVLHAGQITAQAALDRIDGTAQAGAAEQGAAEAAARLSTLIADYAAARLASAVLSDVIEAYQERHQGPLLARASTLFAAITDGKFAGVATDFDEDKTILVGVRDSGRREKVAALSSGRRDQLFLALRLAAIERHIASQGPLPVVVDDIVINFDDAAASATFKVLSELAQKTQVLFFTHHEHLLDRAAGVVGAGKFQAHRL